MATITTQAELKKQEVALEQYFASFRTDIKMNKSWNKKSSDKTIKDLVQNQKFKENHKQRVVVNYADVDSMVEKAEDIFNFLKQHNKVQHVESHINIPEDQQEFTLSDEQYHRNEVVKKGFAFCKTIMKHIEVKLVDGTRVSKPKPAPGLSILTLGKSKQKKTVVKNQLESDGEDEVRAEQIAKDLITTKNKTKPVKKQVVPSDSDQDEEDMPIKKSSTKNIDVVEKNTKPVSKTIAKTIKKVQPDNSDEEVSSPKNARKTVPKNTEPEKKQLTGKQVKEMVKPPVSDDYSEDEQREEEDSD